MNPAPVHKEITGLQQLVQVKQQQLQSVLEVTKAINENKSSEDLFELYRQIICGQLGVKELALFTYNEAWKRTLWIRTKENEQFIPVADNIRKFGLVTELNEEEQQVLGGFKYAIPVYHKKQPLALALLGEIHDDLHQQKNELLDFAQVITNIIAVAVENKRLFRREVEKKQFDKELELASKVQGMLIPKKLPKNNIYEFAGLYLPYKGIGGDYYDVIHINKDEFVFCIGDISGKGVAAALVMANLQAYLNATVDTKIKAKKLIENLNKKVFTITNGDSFITLFLAKYNLLTREMVYVNCGHVPPVMICGDHMQLLENGSTLLGVFEELPNVSVHTRVIPPDTTIVCFTDGLTELENSEEEPFTQERLLEFVREHKRYSPEIFNKILFDYISKFKGNMLFSDDISVLTAKFY
jgi:sigma-B regulation protein RsbU (phosphoserine phosphatase)